MPINNSICSKKIGSKSSVPYSLVYKFDIKETIKIAAKGESTILELGLENRVPFDTIKSKRKLEKLPHGQYFSVRLFELDLRAELLIIQDLEYGSLSGRVHQKPSEYQAHVCTYR